MIVDLGNRSHCDSRLSTEARLSRSVKPRFHYADFATKSADFVGDFPRWEVSVKEFGLK